MTLGTSLFQKGKVYISDYAGNISYPYDSFEEALKYSVEGDYLFIPIPYSDLKKPVTLKETSKVSKIIIDFNKNSVTIESTESVSISLAGKMYTSGTSDISADSLERFTDIINDAVLITKDTEVLGTPPLKGTCLDALLYL